MSVATQSPKKALRSLYPAFEAYRSGMPRVSVIHETCWEESPHDEGQQAVFML